MARNHPDCRRRPSQFTDGGAAVCFWLTGPMEAGAINGCMGDVICSESAFGGASELNAHMTPGRNKVRSRFIEVMLSWSACPWPDCAGALPHERHPLFYRGNQFCFAGCNSLPKQRVQPI